MTLDKATIQKDVNEGAKDKTHPDFSNLLRDIQNEGTRNRQDLKTDIDAANAEIHAHGFPTLSIVENNGKVSVQDTKAAQDNNANIFTLNNDQSKQDAKNKGEVKRDGDKISEIDYPNGNKAKFYYDKDNKLIGYDDNQRCMQVDKGNVSIDQKTGDVTFEDAKSKKVVHTDGSSSEYDKEKKTTTDHKADGSTVTHREDGQISEIKYPNGKTAKFDYDNAGQLVGYHDQEGRHWKKEEGVWRQTNEKGDKYLDEKGNETTDKTKANVQKGDIKIDKSTGDLTFEDGKAKKAVHTDGTVSDDYEGRRTKNIKIDHDKVSHTVEKGDTLWAIAEDNLSRTNGGKKGSVAEIQKEIKRIADEYNKKNPDHQIKPPYNKIPIGAELPLS